MADELGQLLTSQSKALTSVGEALIERDKPRLTATLTGLMTSLATQIPVLGDLVDKAVATAFTNSVNAQLDAELAALASHTERQQLASEIAEVLEPLIGQALIQLIRSQHNLADEQKAAMTQELGGLRDDLAQFRTDFAAALGSTPAVRIQRQVVTGGALGIRVGAGTRQRAFVKRQDVSGPGSIGIDLT